MKETKNSSYELKEGNFDPRQVLTEDDLRSIFSIIYSSRSKKTTSYKYALINAILCNLANIDCALSLSFNTVFYTFAESCWNIIVNFKIKPARVEKSAKIYSIIDECSKKLDVNEAIPFDSLSSDNIKTVVKAVESDAKKYVIGALFGDSQGTFYSFSKKEKVIRLNPVVYQYLLKNKPLIEKVNYLEWTRFLLEKELDVVSPKNIIDALTLSTKRSDLSSFQKILYETFNEHKCFYCGKELKNNEVHVDHFIPWSFIKDDRLWNFVISCPHCNESKSDKLASTELLHRLVKRNEDIISKQPAGNILINTNEYDNTTLMRFYHIAKMNGFELWNKSNSR